MRRRWTRKVIIQEILRREAEGLTLSVGRRDGVGQALYQAANRFFGSWREALRASGVSPHRALPSEKWPPQMILNTIRHLAKRKRPLNMAKLGKKFPGLVSAARRLFGSWPKAILAAGVDPKALRCISPWSRERIIEGILVRAIRNEPIGSRTTEPRSLVDAAQREFGSWAAAKRAAGLIPNSNESDCPNNPQPRKPQHLGKRVLYPPSGHEHQERRRLHRPGEPWTPELVLRIVHLRLERGQPLNAATIRSEDNALHQAAERQFGNWTKTLVAAGLNPEDHRQKGRHATSPDSDRVDVVSPLNADETKRAGVSS